MAATLRRSPGPSSAPISPSSRKTPRNVRSPWSCTFCRMREASGGPQCHVEAEVLARLMRPEEQLIHDYGEHFKEAMWLGLGKERLTEKVYTAAWFVRDMRLIFFNHKKHFTRLLTLVRWDWI
ncbi:Sp110 nuclear body protein [Manis javanica]|nr:Sp110 nuclear body protein [Manis javanica]